MNTEHLPHKVLLVLGIMGLLKSLWGVIHPDSAQRAGRWWSRAALQVNTLAGCTCLVLAVALWAVVLIDQPIANWVLVAIGSAAAWTATVYFRPDQFQRLMDRLVLDRKPVFVRVVSACAALLCVLFIWIAFKRL
jgi:hypothetical protein